MGEYISETSKDFNENFNLNLNKIALEIIRELPKRSKEVIIKRFGFTSEGNRKTLDEIGREYGITRERVRQVEFETISKIADNREEKCEIEVVLSHIKNTIKEHGGVIAKEKIINQLLDKEDKIKKNTSAALFFLSLDRKLKKIGKTRIHKEVCFYKEENFLRFKNIIKTLENHLEEKRRSVSFAEIIEFLKYKHREKEFLISRKIIASYLEANRVILKNVLGRWGSDKWPYINPKGVKDKIYLVLKKCEKPMHFIEITDKINELWNTKQCAKKQTVHNELIRDNRFVLVGRGIYALSEWGYDNGVVLDVIIKILKNSKNGMEESEIVKRVLEERIVKKNTVLANLKNKKYFEKLSGKIFVLKQ